MLVFESIPMRNFLSLLLFLICLGCSDEPQPSYTWSFAERQDTTIVETRKGLETPLLGNQPVAEYVPGIAGAGLRLDGHTAYVRQPLPDPLSSPFTMAAWIALETYPTDTAGFFAVISGPEATHAWSAGLDRFGRLVLGREHDGQRAYLAAQASVEKFSWFHVALSVGGDSTQLYLNGEPVAAAKNPNSPEYREVLIGKDFAERRVHIFPTEYINGIVDEVQIWPEALPATYVKNNLVKDQAGGEADLSIPESRFADDFYRPEYHVLPAANWTNETHGLIYHDGKYHIFNQKNGTNVYLGQINWGHYSSPDLLQWTEHRPAITPEDGYDRNGIWSGHVVKANGQLTIMYTGSDGAEFGMCLAFPADDDLIEWEKYEGNPVVRGTPEKYERIDFRDPYLWKEGDTWYMMVGYGITENEVRKGALLLYKSTDLTNWETLDPLFVGDPERDSSGVFWEMAIFWKMGEKYVLLANPIPYQGKPAVAIYWVGDFVNEQFVPDDPVPKKLEVINRLLSPSVARDADGETVVMGIIPDLISAEWQRQHGWTHLYSMPRRWELVDGVLKQQPHPVMKELRLEQNSLPAKELAANDRLAVAQGQQLEIEMTLTPETASRFGLLIGHNEENAEATKILFDLDQQQLTIDQRKMSQRKGAPVRVEQGDLSMMDLDTIHLQLFIDGSVVEGFLNKAHAFTTRIFPKYEDSDQVVLFSEDGRLRVSDIQYWPLRSSENKVDF